MRFDDRLTTVLGGDPESPRGRATLWRQVVDLLAQDGDRLAPAVAERLLCIAAMLAPHVSIADRAMHAAAIVPGCRFLPLIVLLANLDSTTARAAMTTAHLPDNRWLPIIPEIGPVARNQLRQRNDLPKRLQQALHLFSASDTALPAPPVSNDISGALPNGSEIRDLVRRIEEYRQKRELQPRPDGAIDRNAATIPTLHLMRFVTDVAGRIVDIENAPRGRFIGIDLSQPARPDEAGCDAGTARRVTKRSPIDLGRLLLNRGDEWAGTWLIDAQPHFAREDGAFLGYAGSLRRPTATEMAEPANSGQITQETASLAPDLVRQLVHELRSPLNAIAGFAQMIDGQYAGPVATGYRDASRAILADADALLSAIDEIDLLASSVSAENSTPGDHDKEPSHLVADIVQQLSAGRPGGLPHFVVSAGEGVETAVLPGGVDLSRILNLLLKPIASSLRPEHQLGLTVTSAANGEALSISVERLTVMDGGDPQTLDALPGLGFGFAAARRLAELAGGSLLAEDHQYILNLPTLDRAYQAEDRAH